jgi:hypothetical protein
MRRRYDIQNKKEERREKKGGSLFSVNFYCYCSLHISFFYDLAFIILFFSFSESDRDFYQVSFGINSGWYQRHTLFPSFLLETEDSTFFEKKFSFSFDSYIAINTKFVRAHMHANDFDFSRTDENMGTFELARSLTNTLYFPAKELYTCLMLLDKFIVMKSFAVYDRYVS